MIIPALDLIDGKIVRLYQGDFKQKTKYINDPQTQLNSYSESGADWIHIVDLDGAKDVKNRQLKLIQNLIKNTTAKIQIGGGVRTQCDLQNLFDIGASRVVIGSMAVTEPETVSLWIEKFDPSKIVLALDINIDKEGNKNLATFGWQEQSTQTIESLLNQYLKVGLKHVLCTDISKDGTLKGSNGTLYTELSSLYPQIDFQGSGGIGSLQDIKEIAQTGASSIIVGRALLENKFTLKEAISCWQNV